MRSAALEEGTGRRHCKSNTEKLEELANSFRIGAGASKKFEIGVDVYKVILLKSERAQRIYGGTLGESSLDC